eukprot:m.129952 g.129952  ORF g.129952 m.129952 type:complete len:258 (-) comp14588_c0_seq4:78-851(-)
MLRYIITVVLLFAAVRGQDSGEGSLGFVNGSSSPDQVVKIPVNRGTSSVKVTTVTWTSTTPTTTSSVSTSTSTTTILSTTTTTLSTTLADTSTEISTTLKANPSSLYTTPPTSTKPLMLTDKIETTNSINVTTIQVNTNNNNSNTTLTIVGVLIGLVVALALVFAVINRLKLKDYFRPHLTTPQPNPTQPNPVYDDISEGLRYLERLNSSNHDTRKPYDTINILDENGYVLDATQSKRNEVTVNLDEDAYVLDNSDT